jgi:hypothetical protein
MKNYKITVSYDGTRYKGWQVLKSTDATIQGKLQMVLSALAGHPVEVIGSGRTDAGVHAIGQVANFHLDEHFSAEEIFEDLNRHLPEDIAVTKIKEVDDRFHSRYQAVEKTYRYRIRTSPVPNVFERKFLYQYGQTLDVDKMKKAAQVESNAAGDVSTVTFTPTSLSVVATGISTETLIRQKQAPADADSLTYQTLGTIDLTPSNGWTVDTTKNIFKRAEDSQKGWKANSYMISNFMMPTPEEKMQKSKNLSENETTFYLHYTDGTHHRYDNIRLSAATGDKFKFPIEANHLYCLGAKSKTVNQPYDLKEYYEPVMTDVNIEIEPAFEKKHVFETE